MKMILAVAAGLLLMAASLFAGDGDLIVDGNLGVGTTTPTAKVDVAGKIRSNLPYQVIADSTERTTTSTTYVYQNNISCSVSAQTGDLVMVHLDGWYKNTTTPMDAIGYLNVYSGSATRLGGAAYFKSPSVSTTEYSSHPVSQIFQATADGTLQFRMMWKANGGGTAYTKYRVMSCWVMGRG